MRSFSKTVVAVAAVASAAAIAFALTPGALAGEKPKAGAMGAAKTPVMSAAKEVVWPADQLQFKPVQPGITKAVLWGDPTKGAYGALTRFAAGTKVPLHTHSHDIKVVVISGTFVYGTTGGEQRLGPGSYLFEPGGKKHTSGAEAGADCLFFEESPGKWDIQMVEGGASASK